MLSKEQALCIVKCMVVVLLGSHSDTPDIIGNFMKLLKKR